MGIDSLMWQQPDSAFALLLDFAESPEADSLDVFNGHYFQLLVAELLYKNDYLQTNRPELLRAVACFDSLVAVGGADARGVSVWPFQRRDASNASAKTAAFLAARAHYINGVGYYERDSVVEACEEYMKTLETMEDHFEEKELTDKRAQFMALTYTHLTGLFSDQYLHEQAIYFGKLSLHYYHKYEALPWHKAWMLEEIGTHYDMMNQLDSAEYYYQNALMALDDINNLLYRDITTHRAYLEYEISGEAYPAINVLSHLFAESKSQEEYLARAAIIGELFYHEKLYDSAWVYLKMTFEKSTRNDSKKQAAEWLASICAIQHHEDESAIYASFLVPFANQEENKSEIKSQLTQLYNTYSQNILERQYKRAVRKRMTWVFVATSGLLATIMAIVFLIQKNRKKQKQPERESIAESDVPIKTWDKYAAFMDEPICQEILHSIQEKNIKRSATPMDYPNLVLSNLQLQQLSVTVKRYFNPIENLFERYGIKATPIMVSLCHLYLLGIEEKQAAILLNRDYSSISRYGKKLKTAFETQENLTTFFKMKLINE